MKFLRNIDIANEPMALLGIVSAFAYIVLDVINAIEVEGVDTWVGVVPVVIAFIVRQFVDGPKTNA